MNDTITVTAVAKEFRSWSRRTVRALDGVSLRIGRSEVFGLLGSNGAGKTTLVKILLGLTRPTAGSVALRGLPPTSPQSRRRVGYLPEGHRFPGYLTGEAALRLFGRLAGVEEGVLQRKIPELLELVGLAGRGGDRIARYSKGMTQRLGLAAALVDEPDLLFLDEPTDGVDPVGRRHIRDVLLAQRERGATIFINSHLLSEVERTCDRIAVLDRGALVHEGSIEALTRPARRFAIRLEGALPAVPLPATQVVGSNGTSSLEIEGVGPLNDVIDTLRAAGSRIVEVAPVRSSLEDVFVQIVAAHAAGAPRPVPTTPAAPLEDAAEGETR